ncbi:MAG: hypothetical protein ACPG4K_07385 [Haloferula sp.]
MPIGEFVTEITLRVILEFIVLGTAYWTGWILLKLLSWGRLRIAPFKTLETRNRTKGKPWLGDWSIWLHNHSGSKSLKADASCLTGLISWALAGAAVYLATR